MKFLIDNNLSPLLSIQLNEAGFDSVHVKEIKRQTSSDEQIFQRAYKEERIIVSADTDFGYILSQWKQSLPSVILFRHFSTLPDKQFVQLLPAINTFKNDLLKGVLVIIEPEKTRIKNLPF